MNRILIIDDSSTLRELLKAILTLEGFEVHCAENGEAGLAAANAVNPQLILCDVNMPGLDGFATLARLRHEPRTARIPLLFLSTQTAREQIEHGLGLGAQGYLTKPFDSPVLISAVRAQLGLPVPAL